MKLSFVIPCYGSEDTIENVINEITNVISQKQDVIYEIICVNDCSPDNVFHVLKQLSLSHPNLIVIDLTYNMGKESAVMAGYSIATGDIVVSLDDDGQCPMPHLWELIEPLNNGYDVSIAKHPVKKQSRFKNFGSKVNKIMAQMLIGLPKDMSFSSFFAMKRFIVDEVLRYRNPYPYVGGLIIRATQNIAQVTIDQRERIAGRSNYTFFKLLKTWLNGFTSFSVKPLRISTALGLVISLISFIAGIYIMFKKLFLAPDMAIGYPSLIITILFMGGMIMMMLGMLGEYIGRIYICINASPQYVIREIIRGNSR